MDSQLTPLQRRVIGLLAGLGWSLTGGAGCGGPSESAVAEAIKAANYCEVAEDCEFIGAVCPLGCSIYVNTAEAEEVLDLLDRFDGGCLYKCDPTNGVACDDGVCQAAPAR